jgi:DNA replication protein DnaC
LSNGIGLAFATCDCKLKWTVEVEAYEACIPVEFWHFDPKTIDTNCEVFSEVIEPWPTYENLARCLPESGDRRGYGLFLEGENGVGKTTFLAWICMQLIRNTQIQVYYTTTLRLIRDFKSTFGNTDVHAAREARLSAMLGRPILVIDELGKESYKAGDSFSRRELETILRDRDEKKLPTLLGSNAGLDQIGKVPAQGGYGPTVFSLIRGNMLEVMLEPGDKRAELGIQRSGM